MKFTINKITFCWLLIMFGITATKAQVLKVAILDFENTSGIAKYDGLGKAMSSMLISDIATNVSPRRLQLVERSQIQKILKEQNFQASSAVDKASTVKAGKILGVKYLLLGDIYILNDALVINARFVDAETGDIKFSKKQEGKLPAWLSLKTNIAKELATSISMPFTEPAIKDKETPIATLTTYGNAISANDAGDTTKALTLLNTVAEFDPEFKYIEDLKNEIDLLKKQVKKNTEDIKDLQKSGDLVVNATGYKEFVNNINSELINGKEKWKIMKNMYDKFPEQRNDISTMWWVFMNTQEYKNNDKSFFENIIADINNINTKDKKLFFIDLIENILNNAKSTSININNTNTKINLITTYNKSIEKSIILRHYLNKPNYDIIISKFFHLIVNDQIAWITEGYPEYITPTISAYLDSFVKIGTLSDAISKEFILTYKGINENSKKLLIDILFEHLVQNPKFESFLPETQNQSPLVVLPFKKPEYYNTDRLKTTLIEIGSKIIIDENNKITINNIVYSNNFDNFRENKNFKIIQYSKIIDNIPFDMSSIKSIYALDKGSVKTWSEDKIADNYVSSLIKEFSYLLSFNQSLKKHTASLAGDLNDYQITSNSTQWSSFKSMFKNFDSFSNFINQNKVTETVSSKLKFLITNNPDINGICHLNGEYYLALKHPDSNVNKNTILLKETQPHKYIHDLLVTFDNLSWKNRGALNVEYKPGNFWFNIITLVQSTNFQNKIDFAALIQHLKNYNKQQLDKIKKYYEIEKQNQIEIQNRLDRENQKGMDYFKKITTDIVSMQDILKIDTQFYYKLSLFSDFERKPYLLLQNFKAGYNNIIDTSRTEDRIKQLSNAIGIFANLIQYYNSLKDNKIEIENYYTNGNYYDVTLKVSDEINACKVNQYQGLMLLSTLRDNKENAQIIKLITKLNLNYKFSSNYGDITIREMLQNDFEELYKRELIKKELYQEVNKILKK